MPNSIEAGCAVQAHSVRGLATMHPKTCRNPLGGQTA